MPTRRGESTIADFAKGVAVGTFLVWSVEVMRTMSNDGADTPPMLGACNAVLMALIISGAMALTFLITLTARLRSFRLERVAGPWPTFFAGATCAILGMLAFVFGCKLSEHAGFAALGASAVILPPIAAFVLVMQPRCEK